MPQQEQPASQLPSSSLFLKQVELQRLSRECYCLLDLRKLSSDFCRRYSYRGRSLWLDANAHRMFLETLEKNSGTFTIGGYESILEAYPQPESKGPLSRESKDSSIFDTTGKIRQQMGLQNRQVSVFEFGYFEKRIDKRIKYAMPVLLLVAGKVIPAKTRDISYRGLRLRAKTAIRFQTGDSIHVKIPPATIGGERLPEARFSVVKAQPLLSEIILSLVTEEPRSHEALQFFRDIVSKEAGTSFESPNLDQEDSLLTSHSILAERYYLRSSTIIPLFLFRAPAEEAPLKIVFKNENNSLALRAFETSTGHHDLSPLAREEFIKTLAKVARRDGQADALLAVRRAEDGESPLTLIQTEFKESAAWYRFLAKHSENPNFFVFKIVARFVRKTAAHRILSDLDPLATKSTDLAEKLFAEAENLRIAGSLIDVTAQIRQWDLSRLVAMQPGLSKKDPPPPQGDEHLPAPEIWPVKFIEEKRADNRFTGQMRVVIQIEGRKFGARTRDISIGGLAVFSDDPDLPVEKGSRVRVSFPDLKKSVTTMEKLRSDYKDIPYDVVDIKRGTPTLLRLKQSSGEQNNRFTRVLSDFIEQRRSKLPLELSHLYRSAAFRLYSSHFIESSGTIPFFLAQKGSGKNVALKIGIVQSPSYLAKFFELAAGELDFTALIEAAKLDNLVSEMQHKGVAEITLFVFKVRIPGTQRFRIVVPDTQAGRVKRPDKRFINSLGNPDFRYIKLMISRPQLPPKVEIEQAIRRLASAPRPKVNELVSEFSGLTAVGDIVDITGQYGPLQPVGFED